MLDQQNNLIHVSGVMQQLARDRLDYGVFPSGNKYFAVQVCGLQRSDRVEDASPPNLPPLHDFFTGGRGSDLEFPIAVTVWFFAVAGKKIGPAGAHVSSHVFYEHGNAIGIRIDKSKYIFVGGLGESILRQFFVAVKVSDRVGEVCRTDILLGHENSCFF
jgi:hypothetical protein